MTFILGETLQRRASLPYLETCLDGDHNFFLDGRGVIRTVIGDFGGVGGENLDYAGGSGLQGADALAAGDGKLCRSGFGVGNRGVQKLDARLGELRIIVFKRLRGKKDSLSDYQRSVFGKTGDFIHITRTDFNILNEVVIFIERAGVVVNLLHVDRRDVDVCFRDSAGRKERLNFFQVRVHLGVSRFDSS